MKYIRSADWLKSAMILKKKEQEEQKRALEIKQVRKKSTNLHDML